MILLDKNNIKKCRNKTEVKLSDFSSISGAIGTLFKLDNLILPEKYEWYIFETYYIKNDKKVRQYLKRVLNNFSVSSYEFFRDYGRANPYDIEYVIHRDCISRDSARFLIEGLKNKTAGTKENFIKRHGEDGETKYNDFRNKSSHSLETFKAKFGKEGEVKYNEYLKKKDSSSLEFFENKFGEFGERKFNEKLDKTKQTLENFISRYGKEDGTLRYNYMIKKKKYASSTLGLVEKFGKEKAFEINASKVVTPETIGEFNYYLKLQKERKTKEANGTIIPLSKKTDFELYTNGVWKETNKQPLKTLENIEKRGHQRDEGTMGLDHIISIKYGFLNNIDIEVIGNINNLQMLTHTENSSKKTNCYSKLKGN